MKKVCFCYILANTSKRYSKIKYYVNYNEKLNHFYGSYRREPQTQDKKTKKHFLIFNFLFNQPTTIFNLLASVFRDLSRQGVI